MNNNLAIDFLSDSFFGRYKRIISRKEAKEKGLNKYFTGKFCRYGHIAERYTKSPNCLECRVLYQKENKDKLFKNLIKWREKNPEKHKAISKKYRDNNKDKTREYQKKWNLVNKEIRKIKDKEYQLNNIEKYTKNQKKWREKNKNKLIQYRLENKEKRKEYQVKNREQINTVNKKYRLEHKEHLYEKRKKWKNKNREKINMQASIRHKTLRKNDINFAIKARLVSRINESIRIAKSFKKNGRTEQLVGCNLKQLKKYLELKFVDGMNWDNRNKWHIDHIVPIKHFIDNYDFRDFEIQKICFHYSNLQPLWAKENISKHDKIDKKIAEAKITNIKKLL